MSKPLDRVFAILEKQGFLARQNFMCCSGCAGQALATEASDLKDKGIEVKGAVYYHQQDMEGFVKNGKSVIRYSQVNTNKHGFIGLEDVEIGNIVYDLLLKQGIETTWTGSPDDVIFVALEEPLEAPEEEEENEDEEE